MQTKFQQDSSKINFPLGFCNIVTLLVCGLTLFLTGCPIKPLPPTVRPGSALTELTTEKVSQMITQRVEQFRNLNGMGKITIQTWEERYRFSEVFVLEKPARFRLETLGFLDQPVIFFTSDEDMLSLYSKKQNAYYRGIASQENLFKLSGLNLSVEDAILVFSGNPPALSPINFEWGMFLPDLQSYYLERTSLQHTIVQRIWFDTKIRAISHLEEYMLTNGKLMLAIDFKDYRAEAGAYPVPASILIDRPLDKTRVKIEYKTFDVNQELDQTVFKFIPQDKNVKTHFIDDATAEQIERLAPYKEFQVKE
jgi:outer membrane lipoprotein-sorting protein